MTSPTADSDNVACLELSSQRRIIPDSKSLADFTTFRIGGPARSLVVARTQAEMIEAVRETDAAAEELLIVSGGSNMLVSDAGFPGTVLIVATQGVMVEHSPTGVRLHVAAGESWDWLVGQTVEQGWSGLELLSGIPGLVGAGPIQNIGAYGAEIASVIKRVYAYDREIKAEVTLDSSDCAFGYRTSLFKRSLHRYVILSVDLELRINSKSAPIEYQELADYLGIGRGQVESAVNVRQAVLELRRNKGMVLNTDDHDTWSAGSFFTNPIIEATVMNRLPADAPRYPQGDGSYKTSAAWLIEQAGFSKGYGDGPAQLSTKHVLALTNRGKARAEDVLDLARTIQAGVKNTFGITLTPEPQLVGLTL